MQSQMWVVQNCNPQCLETESGGLLEVQSYIINFRPAQTIFKTLPQKESNAGFHASIGAKSLHWWSCSTNEDFMLPDKAERYLLSWYFTSFWRSKNLRWMLVRGTQEKSSGQELFCRNPPAVAAQPSAPMALGERSETCTDWHCPETLPVRKGGFPVCRAHPRHPTSLHFCLWAVCHERPNSVQAPNFLALGFVDPMFNLPLSVSWACELDGTWSHEDILLHLNKGFYQLNQVSSQLSVNEIRMRFSWGSLA